MMLSRDVEQRTGHEENSGRRQDDVKLCSQCHIKMFYILSACTYMLYALAAIFSPLMSVTHVMLRGMLIGVLIAFFLRGSEGEI